ncbi:MAG: DUF1465 family protein [Alphaproteobacteria bacterium]
MDFNDKNFQDILKLAEEAKEDQMLDINNKEKRFDVVISPKVMIERMEITAQIGYLMSWFFYQKAVENGEISEFEALKMYKPLCESCLFKTCNGRKCISEECACRKDNIVTESFAKLREKTSELYCRISRLDKMLRDKEAAAV